MRWKNMLIIAGAVVISLAGCEDKKNAGVSAVNDNAVVQSGHSVNIDVLANDGKYTSNKTIKGWTQGGHGSTVKENNNTITYTPNDGYVGRDSFNYILKVDQYESQGEVNVTITDPAVPDNEPPTVSAGDDKTVQVDESIDINGTDNDSDGNIVTRSWKEGSALLSEEQSFVYTPTVAGQHKLVYTVTDDDGASASDEMNVTATEVPVNHAPVAQNLNESITDCDIGAENSFQLVATDEDDGDTLTYALSGSEPDYGKLTIHNDGSGTLRINDSMAQGNCLEGVPATFKFKATDNHGAESNEGNVTLTAVIE